MPPRAMWTGQLRLSLVSFGVRMYAATESGARVSMNQLHRGCHQRLKNQLTCPIHGPVERDDVVKGYEYEKDTYVIIDPEDLEAIRLQANHTIDLKTFVKADAIGPLYVDSPYFLGPDGPVAEEAFRVIREAMRATNTIGIGTLIMSARERIVSVQPEGKGFLLNTLRYATEVRSSDGLFDDVKEAKPDAEQLQLAETIIKGKVDEFQPNLFEDHYRTAFLDVVKAKIKGQKPVIVEETETPTTYNFIDALKRSVEEAGIGEGKKNGKKPAKKPAAKSAGAEGKKSKTKRA
ncbi:MAG: Ku protein [Phycisphaerales bacterium]|nr:Ku protein [Phycisphaerales bacterium]